MLTKLYLFHQQLVVQFLLLHLLLLLVTPFVTNVEIVSNIISVVFPFDNEIVKRFLKTTRKKEIGTTKLFY